MLIHADFGVRVVLRPGERAWVASPTPGVERQMLDRIGAEVARATSLVRYAPNASFPEHIHGGGEEFFVLEGLFCDAEGCYPAGTYVRNPIGTAHAPWAGPEGAVLLVKLHQFDPMDTVRLVVDTRTATWLSGPGLKVLPLHAHGSERVQLLCLAPQTHLEPCENEGGEELFVLAGGLTDDQGSYPQGSWLRSPHRSTFATGPEGALLYCKTGHLLPEQLQKSPLLPKQGR